MAKKETPQERMEALRNELIKDAERWEFIRDNGAGDPFWADGFNMNLVRNHIIFGKGQMMELSLKEDVKLPPEYNSIQTPPEVDDDYMAKEDAGDEGAGSV